MRRYKIIDEANDKYVRDGVYDAHNIITVCKFLYNTSHKQIQQLIQDINQLKQVGDTMQIGENVYIQLKEI